MTITQEYKVIDTGIATIEGALNDAAEEGWKVMTLPPKVKPDSILV